MALPPIFAAFGPTAQFLGSILVFLILLSQLVFVHEAGHFFVAKRSGVKVEEFGFGFPPRLWATRRGDTEYSVNAVPLGGFVRMLGEDDPTQPRSFARARKLWRFAILVAGSTMNFLLAVVLFTGAFTVGWPTVTQSEVQVMTVMPGLPAEAAGLKAGDVVLTLAGQPVHSSRELRQLSEQNAGREVPLEVRRDNATVALKITPRATWPEGEGPLGVSIGDRPVKVEPVAYPLARALWRGVEQTFGVVAFTFYLPVLAFKGLLPWSVVRPVGPVGIYSIASQAAVETVQTGWWFPILSVAASLSAGLGLANLLPIPGLDGGRLLFILLEAVRGRRIDPQKEGMIHLVGLAVLFSLVIVITFADISAPVNVDWGLR